MVQLQSGLDTCRVVTGQHAGKCQVTLNYLATDGRPFSSSCYPTLPSSTLSFSLYLFFAAVAATFISPPVGARMLFSLNCFEVRTTLA